MVTIRKSLLQFVFSGSFMKRWNDKLRPIELWEVDKQAHKMIIAWILLLLNTEHQGTAASLETGQKVIEGGIFEYLYRLIITDIKPPIFYRIKSNPHHYQQLTEWVLEQLAPKVQPLGEGFFHRLSSYFQAGNENTLDRRILQAAHLYASWWEFSLIKDLNPWDGELKEIEENFMCSLSAFQDLKGVADLLDQGHNPLKEFVLKCGQLRFQKRWSQTPRIPETSVLGHMFIVACYAYFFSLALQESTKLAQNNFFAGLFHDLPELLTRDIISPVKSSVQKIGNLIKEYEEQETERQVFSLLERGGFADLSKRLAYFLGIDVGSEFIATIRVAGETKEVSGRQVREEYNKDHFDPKDGEMLKVCDSLAAFIEAYTAMRNGITTDQLQQALWRIKKEYQQVSLGPSLHVGSLLADFD